MTKVIDPTQMKTMKGAGKQKPQRFCVYMMVHGDAVVQHVVHGKDFEAAVSRLTSSVYPNADPRVITAVFANRSKQRTFAMQGKSGSWSWHRLPDGDFVKRQIARVTKEMLKS